MVRWKGELNTFFLEGWNEELQGAYLAGNIIKSTQVVKEECGTPFPKMVLREKGFNTCRCQDHRLQQVRQRDDAPHYVSPVHQD